MSDAGGPGSARKCPGPALADLGDTEGFEKDGEEGQLYGLQLSDGVYNRKKVVTQVGGGARKLSELSDVDVSYAAPGGSTRWRLLGESGLPSQTPSKKRGGLWMWKFRHRTWRRGSITRFGRWQMPVPGCVPTFLKPRTWSFPSAIPWRRAIAGRAFSKWFLSSPRLGSSAWDCLLPRSFSS